MDRDEALTRYLTWLADARRVSPNTLAAYRRDLDALFGNLNGVLADLKPADLRRALAREHQRGLSPTSLARRLTAWRRFFHYLTQHHGWKTNPCDGVRPPRRSRRLPTVLSPDAVAQLLSGSENTLLAHRDQAMFELLYSAGLRVSELTALDVGDVDLKEQEVTVRHGKGGKGRVAPLGTHAVTALQAWLTARGIPTADAPLFIGQHGNRLSVRSVQLRIKATGVRQGLDRPVHPHLMRHACASHVLQSSGDLRAVQELLGHASIASTQVYTHLDFQHLAKVYDAAHPRAKKK